MTDADITTNNPLEEAPTTETLVEASASTPASTYSPPTTLFIPISKVKLDGKTKTIEVDYQRLPDHIMILALQEGLKTLLNSKQSKLSTAKLEGDKLAEAQAKVMEQVGKNLAMLYDGSFAKGRPGANTDAVGDKVPAPIVAEARRLARNDVKAALKAANMKISQVKASDITAAANELIAKDGNYYITAKANLEARALTPIAKDIASLVKVDPVLVKRAEDEKAARKAQLSATQAGKAQTRVPPAKGSTIPAGVIGQSRVPQAQTNVRH